MTAQAPKHLPRLPDKEYHDGEAPVCVGQWCCGCSIHPAAKPWGWNNEAWSRHYEQFHSDPAASPRNLAKED